MKTISISLNPTYLCNFSCHFCYLTPEQLRDRKTLDVKRLPEMLMEVNEAGYKLEHVDLYGGEVGLLSEEYLDQLDEILFEFGDPNINIITNLFKKHPFFLKEHIDLSVSFDFDAREKSDLVLSNLLTTNKDISILMLASKELMGKDVAPMIQTFNSIQNIVSVEVKPYSSNQSNQYKVSDQEFEAFVQKWIDSDLPMNFDFINEEQIKLALQKKRNAFSDDHVYITPNGKFAVLEFDENDNELFFELNSFADYVEWSVKERERVFKNSICGKCEYLGSCLTEHYREVRHGDVSCNGYRGLLKNYTKSFRLNGDGLA